MLRPDILEKLVTPKPHRKGATEVKIYADNERARMTAKLVSELAPARRAALIQGAGK